LSSNAVKNRSYFFSEGSAVFEVIFANGLGNDLSCWEDYTGDPTDTYTIFFIVVRSMGTVTGTFLLGSIDELRAQVLQVQPHS
jgi:hypothetical protein